MTQPRRSPKALSLYDVARAVEEDRVALQMQPIVRALDHRFVMFYEGLIRIIDYDGHIRVAGEFMNLVEGTEVGNFVDQCALELAIERLKVNPATRLSINMSTRTIGDSDWLFLLDGAARMNRSVTERLIVEFTESSVMQDMTQALEFMKYCRQHGVNFACDDFGAGHTVLGQLRDFRFDFLKIDGSITQNVGDSVDNQVILEAIISIADHFELTTIAEFIDNEKAADMCAKMNVDGLQGFLFGKGEFFHSPKLSLS